MILLEAAFGLRIFIVVEEGVPICDESREVSGVLGRDVEIRLVAVFLA